jgi:hypothetical protein
MAKGVCSPAPSDQRGCLGDQGAFAISFAAWAIREPSPFPSLPGRRECVRQFCAHATRRARLPGPLGGLRHFLRWPKGAGGRATRPARLAGPPGSVRQMPRLLGRGGPRHPTSEAAWATGERSTFLRGKLGEEIPFDTFRRGLWGNGGSRAAGGQRGSLISGAYCTPPRERGPPPWSWSRGGALAGPLGNDLTAGAPSFWLWAREPSKS